MKMNKKDRNSFDSYVKPLRLLEIAFQSARIPLVFEAGQRWRFPVFIALGLRLKDIALE